MEPIIAILDDGLHRELHRNLCFCLEAAEGIVRAPSSKSPRPRGHGDICAAIIRRYARDAQIGGICILESEHLLGSVQNLIAAVNWCIAHGVNIVHMSLGSIEAGDCLPLYSCMKQAYDAGLILVAACSNERQISFPASFPFVIGVKARYDLEGDAYSWNPEPFSGIDFAASSSHSLHGILENRTPLCNSFAAPLITAKIFNLMQEEPSLRMEGIRERLIENGRMPERHIPAWDRAKVMNVRRFSRTISCLGGKKDDLSEVPVLAVSGEDACFGMEVLAHMFMKNRYMPLLLVERGLHKPEFGHWIDSSIEVMKQNAVLSDWFNADIILLHASITVWQDSSAVLAPDILFCAKNFRADCLCASVIGSEGEVLFQGNDTLENLCARIFELLTKEG